MKISPFKMRVTPEQSRVVQEILFENDVMWAGHLSAELLSHEPYFFVGEPGLTCMPEGHEEYFERDERPELTFEQFKAKYMEKELKVKAERVRETAEKCSSVKSVLKDLFPEAFEENYLDKICGERRGRGQIFLEPPIHGFIEFFHKAEGAGGIRYDLYTKIPGENAREKAESVAKLIYETWVK